ncbi:abortive infection family protein [Bellilinea sp.]|uniref:abortive infection family protein n=1 Tax=Bellilinea sp. TaxID=2838785 RepID=UPI002ADE21DA|nr:abortive infection family protein [Bellilinea sp.]
MVFPNSPTFQMYGAREAIAGGFSHIEKQVNAIEEAIANNPGLAFDLARTLIESVCRTILKERSLSYDENDDLPKLFKKVSESMPFLPPSASQHNEVRQSLKQTLNGLNTAVQGVCELRNQCGFASHGADAPRPSLEAAQAILAASAADTIVGFLYKVHQQDRAIEPKSHMSYEDYPDFNEWVDSEHGTIQIFELKFRPSEVLFIMDPQGYQNYLAEYAPDTDAVNANEETNA